MDPPQQAINPDASSIIPLKRKRGRPRKDPSEKRAQRARSQAARMASGFVHVNSTHPPQVEPLNVAVDGVIGQPVTGVVEAIFDAGYLLAVRIGNSNTTLRGVVFKPGHSAPVTAENDVAPHVEMIRRNAVQFPSEVQPPARRRKRRSREKNMQLVTYVGNGSIPANQVPTSSASSQGNYFLAPSVPPVGARGTVVPVVLQPVNLSNGLSTNQPAPHLRALKGKPVHTVMPLAVYPPNGSTSQASESQTSSQVTPTVSGNENGPFKHGTPDVQEADGVKGEKSNDVQQGEFSANQDGDDKAGSDVADMNEPLFVEPLQTRHSGHHFQHIPFPGHVEHTGTGRMTELLQAVQQKLGDDKVPLFAHPAAVPMVVHKAEEPDQSHMHSQGGSM